MDEKEFYENLVNRYLQNKATTEELEILFQLAEAGKLDEVLSAAMDKEIVQERAGQQLLTPGKIQPRFNWYRLAAAASVILVLSFGTYFLFRKPPNITANINTLVKAKDIKPGGNRAILTLANGSTIVLDDVKNGILAQQGSVSISKSANGQVSYNFSAGKTSDQEVTYNTITTPRGGQYQVILGDGSKVFLNASSSIRFPTAFTGGERSVQIKGEAYFEIAKNKLKPFIVHADQQRIEVLGTHFNVNSYADEAFVKTTLLEGSVKISQPGTHNSKILKPGQQAQVFYRSHKEMLIADANTEEAVAWKEGYFLFEREDIQSIMRKVARWYDVDIRYEGKIPDKQFGGSISRFSNVKELLEVLELTGSVHFRIEGRRITVMA